MKRINDPRVHLTVLLIATIISFFIHRSVQLHLLMAISICYVWHEKGIYRAGMLLFVYSVITVLVSILSQGAGGIAAAMFLFMRMLPLFAIGSVLASSPASSLLYVSDRMYLPHCVIIMICVLLRFSSMIRQEMASIVQGIRARGLLPHWYSIFLHPIQSYECFVLPLIIRGLKLSGELTCAAEFRGIESECRRTTIYLLSRWKTNIIMIIGYSILAMAVWVWED